MSALFKGKKNTSAEQSETKVAVEQKPSPAKEVFAGVSDRIASVLRSPRITEKATDMQMDNNVYTFNVDARATKQEIKEAVKRVYNVTVESVRIVSIPRKQVRTRKGHVGFKSGGKKAYVHLKKGDNIEFV